MIWGSRWYVVVLPALIYLASSGADLIRSLSTKQPAHCRAVGSFFVFFLAVLVIMSVVNWALPHVSILNGTLRGGVPWVSLSVSLNITVTSMICFRLLRMRALLRRELGPEMSRMYTNIAAMVVESSAPFSILGIGVLVTAAHNGPLSYAFGYVWTMFYVECPESSLRTHFCE